MSFPEIAVLKAAGLRVKAEDFGAYPLSKSSLWVLIDTVSRTTGPETTTEITVDRDAHPAFIGGGYEYTQPATRALIESMIAELTEHFRSITVDGTKVKIEFGVISAPDPSSEYGVKEGSQRWHLEISLTQPCCSWFSGLW